MAYGRERAERRYPAVTTETGTHCTHGEDRQRPERAGEEREAEPGQESPNSRSPRALAIVQIVMAKPYS